MDTPQRALSHRPRTGSTANGQRRSGSSLPVDWEHLARATAHPLRVSILEILGIDGGRILSPSDLSQELQIPLSNTNYHVTELAKGGADRAGPPAPGTRRDRALLPDPDGRPGSHRGHRTTAESRSLTS